MSDYKDACFKMPGVASGTFIPPMIEIENARRKAEQRRETRRFIITTVIASIAAVASVVAATASIISCLS